ncbi:collagen alpha-1(I) chain-like [Pteropus medius]|uniref:collagen alpha-1(I) chain-like n=1 Tax=Pteropus vampyrus TaxID=132908 RepID=UPI00196AC1D1|nr:collagen alpha-1(I) chain-like [Pteropus giganteus]
MASGKGFFFSDKKEIWDNAYFLPLDVAWEGKQRRSGAARSSCSSCSPRPRPRGLRGRSAPPHGADFRFPAQGAAEPRGAASPGRSRAGAGRRVGPPPTERGAGRAGGGTPAGRGGERSPSPALAGCGEPAGILPGGRGRARAPGRRDLPGRPARRTRARGPAGAARCSGFAGSLGRRGLLLAPITGWEMSSLALVPSSGLRAPRRLCRSAGEGGGAGEWRSLADFWAVSVQSREKKAGTRLRKVPLVRTGIPRPRG